MQVKHHTWESIPNEQMNDLVTRQVLHTETMTIARLTLLRGAKVPRHSHPNQQVTTMESGALRFIFDDGDLMVAAGQSLEIPGGVFHEVEAVQDSVALDLFTPPRADWISGDDAYLRR